MSNQLKGERLSLPLPVLHSRIAVINKLRLRLDEHASRFEYFLVEVGLPLSQLSIPLLVPFPLFSLFWSKTTIKARDKTL